METEVTNTAIKIADDVLQARGKAAACKYLERHDYDIVDRDFKSALGTIDVVATDGNTLVFCNVVTSEGSTGLPVEPSVATLRSTYEQLAMAYMKQVPSLEDSRIRFDIITICIFDKDRAFLKHHLNFLG